MRRLLSSETLFSGADTPDQLEEIHLIRTFLRAAGNGHILQMTECLKDGVDINVISPRYDATALHFAAEQGNVEVGTFLLNYENIKIDKLNGYRRTALMLACRLNRHQFAKLLLENGADPNQRGLHGHTAIHSCIDGKAYRIIFTLLEHGANINVMDEFQRTPLSMALIEHPNIHLARKFLKKGANFELEKHRNLHIFFEVVLNCRKTSDMNFVFLLLDKGNVDVNIRDPLSGRNCLHYVAITGYLPLAKELMESGADRFACDRSFNWTPRKLAKKYNNLIVAEYFKRGILPLTPLSADLWSVVKKLKRRRISSVYDHEI